MPLAGTGDYRPPLAVQSASSLASILAHGEGRSETSVLPPPLTPPKMASALFQWLPLRWRRALPERVQLQLHSEMAPAHSPRPARLAMPKSVRQ